MNGVGEGLLDRLRNDFLDLLGDDGVFAVVEGVRLACGLAVWVAAGGMDALGEGLLKALGGSLLDLAGDSALSGSVGSALAVLVGGRHSDGSLFEDGYLSDQRS